MREEYDFSKGERGKFYNPNATINLPVYLDTEVLDYFSARAKAKGVELNTMVNDLDEGVDEGVESIFSI